MDPEEPFISTRDLKIGFPARGSGRSPKVVASHINVTLGAGEVVCLLGPNGSGKSTLIRTLSGLHNPLGGDIELEGQSLTKFSIKETARKISTVLTDRLTVGNLSVYELVAFGRSPYTGWFGSLDEKDEEIIRWAIDSTGIRQFTGRDVLRLSDGERQKVMIARALAQNTSAILLDEPTAHLDLPNRVEIMRLLRELAHETQKGILLSTHELDLALKAADTLWLISRSGQIITGVPEDLVLDGTFESVFKQDRLTFDRTTGSFALHQSSGIPVALSGDPVAVFWTRRALEREGYIITEPAEAEMQVAAQSMAEGYRWTIKCGKNQHKLSSVRSVLQHLAKKE